MKITFQEQVKNVHKELLTTSGVGIMRKELGGSGNYEYVLITSPIGHQSKKRSKNDNKLPSSAFDKDVRGTIRKMMISERMEDEDI